MSETGESHSISADRGIPVLSLFWAGLAASYLVASACGLRSAALGVVGLMIGALIAVSGRRVTGLIVGLILSGACLHWSDSLLFLAYAPPIAGFAFMALFFQRTLREGSAPLITRVARKEHPDLPLEIARYTRILTWVWVGCFVLMLAIALLLAPMLPLHSWSRWVQGMATLMPATLFLGEYVYRHHYLRDYPHASLLTLMHNIIAVIKEAATKTSPSGPQR